MGKNMTNETREYLVKTISASLIKGCNNKEVSKETGIDYNTVLYICKYYKNDIIEEITKGNNDHIYNLNIDYTIKRILIKNSILSINELDRILSSSLDKNKLKNCKGMTDLKFDNLCKTVEEYVKENNLSLYHKNNKEIKNDNSKTKKVSQNDLGILLLNYIYDNLIMDNYFPKHEISNNNIDIPIYKRDEFFFGEKYFLVKASFLRDNFNKYIADFNVIGNINKHKYFNFAIEMLATNNTIYASISGGKIRAFNQYTSITGNNNTYVKICTNKMEYCINKEINFDLYKYTDAKKLPLATRNKSPYKNSNNNNRNINNKFVMVYSSHRVGPTLYSAVIGNIRKINNISDIEFDTTIDIGNFIFDIGDIENGEILFTEKSLEYLGKNDIEQIKEKVIKFIKRN